MIGFHNLRPLKSLDTDYRGNAEAENKKIVKSFPLKD